MKMNSAELVDKTRTHFMCAWCVDAERNRMLIEKGVMLGDKPVPTNYVSDRAGSTLSFCGFLPSAVRQASVFPNLAFSTAHRVRWANEFLVSERGTPTLFGPRDKDSYRVQSEQRVSFIGSWLRKLKREPKKKPN